MKESLLALLLLPAVLCAQDTTRVPPKGFVSVETDPAGAEVFLDTLRLGTSPLDRVTAAPGPHALQVFFPSSRVWNSFVKARDIQVEPGNELRISLEFGSLLSIRSQPSGALVSHDGTDFGRTPLQFRSPARLRGSLVFRKDQFETRTVSLDDSALSLVMLKPLPGSTESAPDVLLEQTDKTSPRMWGTYGSAAGMVVSGVLAAYFKDRANKEFDLYLSTKVNSHLSSTRAFDQRSSIALVLTEVSFGLLSYFLFSD